MPSAHALAALAAVAQALKTLVNGIPESPTMPTIASGLATVQLPPVANWTSFHSTPASATAAKMASTPISIADLPSNRPNGCSPTPMIATPFIATSFLVTRLVRETEFQHPCTRTSGAGIPFRGSHDLGDRAGVLELFDTVPIHPELHQHDFGVLGRLWRTRRLQRLVVELNWAADHLERLAPAGRLDLDDHVVGDRLLVAREVHEALERCPLAPHRLEVLAPVLEGLAADRLSDEFGCRRSVLDKRHDVGEAWIIGQFRKTQMLECVADVARRADDAEVDRAAVGGHVVRHEGIDTGPCGIGHHRPHRLAGLHALGHAGAPGPPRRTQKRDIDPDGLPGPVAVKKGRRDAARDVHAANRVAERRDALRQCAAQLLGGQRVADAATRPERGAVEAAGVALGTLVAV